jgi:hypothetical protein
LKEPLVAYFDETGTHGAPVVCVAGYLFDTAGAHHFAALHAERVKPLLPAAARGVFHAADCFRCSKQFASLTRRNSSEIFDALIDVLKSTSMYGIIVEIETVAYERQIKRLGAHLRSMVGSAYSICAVRCAGNVAEWLEQHGIAGDVHYYFEAGCRYAGEAAHFFSQIRDTPQLQSRFRFGGNSYPTKDQAPQLQAADLLVWEWQRERATLTVPENQHRGRRKTLKQLTQDGPAHEWEHLTNIGVVAIVNAVYGLKSNRSK